MQKNDSNNMQDLTCDDCSLMNSDIASSVKTIDPCAVSLSSCNGSPNDSEPSAHTLNDPHINNLNNSNIKYNGSLLRGIKLEDAQGEFFASHPNEVTKSEAHISPTTVQEWTQKQVATPTATNIQNQQQKFQTQTRANNHHQHHQYHNHHLQHHHHQLLLHGSDDPLISHGAENVINDEDQSVELKHLLTAVSNGKKEQKTPSPKPPPPTPQAQQQQHQEEPVKLQHTRQQQQQQQQRFHQSKFMATVNAAPGLVQKRTQNGCSSLTKQQLKMKAGLMSAAQQNQQQHQQQQNQQQHTTPPTQKPKPKSKKKAFNGGSTAVKLRFHHQALPPEYLSHYEATQRQQKQSASPANSSAVKATQTAKLPPAKSSHENVRSWLQKIAEIQRAAQQQKQQHQQQQQQISKQTSSEVAGSNDANNNHQSCRMLDSHSPMLVGTQNAVNYERIPATASIAANVTTSASQSSNHARFLSYADLPYMGEMTLNNSKPRRGRKPKKADICHLIYKNYGTIFAKNDPPLNAQPSVQPTEATKQQSSPCEEQPLNLCLRDYQSLDMYSVSSEDENCDAEVSDSGGDTNSDAGDAIADSMLATNVQSAMVNIAQTPEQEHTKSIKIEPMDESPGHLLHPVTAYYRKLLESGILLKHNDGSSSTIASTIAGLPIEAIETIEKDNQIALKIPIPSGFFVAASSSSKPDLKPLLPDYPEPLSTPSSIKSEQSSATTASSNATITLTGSNCNCSCSNGLGTQQPNVGTLQKRKRSAIFIPPMPAENATSPANEVSICKFKFTGGVKPTLQEKKMLSVDSDGNYRYYSGTGDKSMRGYEFFPRESLQQSGFLPGVGGAGAFLNATGERISADVPPPSAGLSTELLQIPDSPTGALMLPTTNVAAVAVSSAATATAIEGSPSNVFNQNHNPIENCSKHKRSLLLQHENHITATQSPVDGCSPQRKKKPQNVRRTSQREKLERTFKEKGFLIQTQQLESAEGATYCKFRQLKKFTRYLFRNWKDYLPDGQALQSPNPGDIASQNEAIESLLSQQSFDVEHHAPRHVSPAIAVDGISPATDMCAAERT